MDRRGFVFAACYGAIITTVAYLIAHGSIIVFIAVMVASGLLARGWALWYRRRHGLPARSRRPSSNSEPPPE